MIGGEEGGREGSHEEEGYSFSPSVKQFSAPRQVRGDMDTRGEVDVIDGVLCGSGTLDRPCSCHTVFDDNFSGLQFWTFPAEFMLCSTFCVSAIGFSSVQVVLARRATWQTVFMWHRLPLVVRVVDAVTTVPQVEGDAYTAFNSKPGGNIGDRSAGVSEFDRRRASG